MFTFCGFPSMEGNKTGQESLTAFRHGVKVIQSEYRKLFYLPFRYNFYVQNCCKTLLNAINSTFRTALDVIFQNKWKRYVFEDNM